jgi:hypothetical protein
MDINNFEGLDSFMRQPTNSRKRGGGLFIKKSDLNKESLLCSNCPEYANERCMLRKCPIIKYRIEYNLASREETLKAIQYDTRNKELKHRIKEVMEVDELKNKMFATLGHQSRFEKAIKTINKKNKSLVAAVYLLTIDNKVWSEFRSTVSNNNIPLEAKKLHSSGEFGYVYYCAAKDLFLGTRSITIGELADKSLVPARVFALIINALSIKQYGLKAILNSDAERN